MKPGTIIILAIILVSAAMSVYFYPQMPEQMASHWNMNGQVDDYMPKFWALFLMPAMSLVMLVLFMIFPRIDPLKKNIEKFRSYFDGFIIFVMLFFLYIHILSIIYNLGHEFDMTLKIVPAVGILFYYCGVLIAKAKRNYFIGIRTPWTLSNDAVWDKTHKLGSKLFKFAGIMVLLSALIPKYSFWIMMAVILIASLYPVVYSYIVFKKLEK